MGNSLRVHKDVKFLIQEAEKLGFRNAGYTGRLHILLIHPNGGKTTLSGTPSRPSSRRNALAQLRRIARGDIR